VKKVLIGALFFAALLPALAGAGASAQDQPGRAVALAAADRLERLYVFPLKGLAAATRLRDQAAAGTYDHLAADALAAHLTSDLADVLHDKHVRVEYSIDVLPPDGGSGTGPSPAEIAAFARFERAGGYGLGRVAHLPGNVGYLDVRFFPDASPARNAVVDGMASAVAYSDAVILDLRRNRGGDPDGVARLLSHFFAPKTHLNDFVGRGDGDPKVTDSTFTSSVPGPQITAPLYVLTSGHTFSGGEECAYDIQTQKRGTLVGEVTGGGANPGGEHRLDDHFEIFVPDARARNPITKTNWEGTGVRPDIAVPQDQALATAYAMALNGDAFIATLPTASRDRLSGIRAKLSTMDDAAILDL
jgi:hypothetical protein